LPVRSVLVGLVALLVGGIVMLIFAITIVGFLIAWLIFLVYLMAILVSLLYRPVVVGAVLGAVLGKSPSERVTPWTIGFGVLVLLFINAIPYVGGIIGLVLWMMAFGALIELCWYKLRGIQ